MNILLIELYSRGDWLLMSVRVFKKIVAEWFQQQNEIFRKFQSTRAIILTEIYAEGGVNVVQ